MGARRPAIVAAVGSRDCYWIGPPTWKQDTGIVAVIRANVVKAYRRIHETQTLSKAKTGFQQMTERLEQTRQYDAPLPRDIDDLVQPGIQGGIGRWQKSGGWIDGASGHQNGKSASRPD